MIRQALTEAQAEKRTDLETRRQRVTKKRQELEERLEALWEDRLRGGVSDDLYRRLKGKYEAGLASVIEEEAGFKTANLDYLARGERSLELCKGVSAAYVTKEVHEQAAFLRIISSNLATDGVTVSATYERPFDVLAERPTRSSWLPRQDDLRTAEAFLQALTAA